MGLSSAILRFIVDGVHDAAGGISKTPRKPVGEKILLWIGTKRYLASIPGRSLYPLAFILVFIF